MTERAPLEQAIAALEAQRAILGDEVIETALAPLRQQLAGLQSETQPTMAGERRQVTALFADLSGFTALAEQLDPEQVRDLVNACFEHMVPIVTRYEGSVQKFIGDEIIAVFGAPVAHENDPERAVRAALEMVQVLDEFRLSNNVDLGLHVGINTGLAIAGDIGTRDQRQYTVMGDTVNLASRLADSAERGEIFVGEDTYRLTAPLFEFAALEPLRLKGKRDPVPVYRVFKLREQPGSIRGLPGLCAVLVGREAECATLGQCLEQLMAGQGQVISVIGEAGIGKSRLMAEWRNMLPGDQVTWLEGRAISFGWSLSHLPFREIIRRILGLTAEAEATVVQARLRDKVTALFPDRVEEVYPYLGRLLALPLKDETPLHYLDGESLKWQTSRVVGDLLLRLAQEKPLILVLEDLHWADPSSVELFESLLPLTEKAPIGLVGVYRPQKEAHCWRFRERAASTLAHRYTEIWLKALSEEYYGLLARHYSMAQDRERALHYLLKAGDQARLINAHEEALDFYQRALVFQQELGDDGGTARTLLKQGLVYQIGFDFERARQNFEQAFALWQESDSAQVDPPPPAPHPLRTVMGSDPATLDPGKVGDSLSLALNNQLFEGLVQLDPELNTVPAAAHSWKVQQGGKRYLFYLRDDLYWSDGSSLTAHDFEYAWKRNLHPATGADYAILLYDVQGARAFHQGQSEDSASVGVRALDDLTLEVHLEEPRSYFLNTLAFPIAYPLPQSMVEAYGPEWTRLDRIITNGPYAPVEWKRGEHLLLSRNPHYRGHLAGNVGQIEFRVMRGSPSHNLALYDDGLMDVACVSDPLVDIQHSPRIDLGQIRTAYPGELVSTIFLQTYYMAFPINRPPFDDRRVRQALAYAMDRNSLVTVGLKGYVLPAGGGFVPPGMAGHSPGIGLKYNPVRARQLLAEAGYPRGRGFPQLSLIAGGAVEDALEDLGVQWQENLGINIRIESIDLGDFVRQMSQEPPSLYAIGWVADYPDADDFLRVAHGVGLFAPGGWDQPLYEVLIAEAASLTDQRRRMEAYHQADQILIEQAIVVPLWYDQRHLLVKPWVKGFRPSPQGLVYYKDVTIEPH